MKYPAKANLKREEVILVYRFQEFKSIRGEKICSREGRLDSGSLRQLGTLATTDRKQRARIASAEFTFLFI